MYLTESCFDYYRESNLQTCESLIYCSSTSGQPSLSPQPIVDTLTQLDAMLKKLEQAVMDVIKDIDHKKKVSFNNFPKLLTNMIFVEKLQSTNEDCGALNVFFS